MIPLLLLFLAAAAPLGAQNTTLPMKVPVKARQAGGVTPAMLTPLEKRFNGRLSTLFENNDQLDLLGNTRGVYLDGFGVVFTAEVSLVMTPAITPFRSSINKETADAVHTKKTQRLPFLKAAMKEMLSNMAATLSQLPQDQQMVVVVRFWYEPWEDLTGMPAQLFARASRKDAIEGNVKVEEQ
jgi:hypothetical protein